MTSYYADLCMLKKQNGFKNKLDYLFVNSIYKNMNILLFCFFMLLLSRVEMIIVHNIFAGITGSKEGFIQAINKWDAGWYISLISDGYMDQPMGHERGDAANWAFFPLANILIYVFYLITNADIYTLGTVINSFVFLTGLFVSFKYILETRGSSYHAFIFIIMMTFGAYSFYFSALYTESLYFLLLVCSFYFLNKRNYILTGIFGALLSGTRNLGVFFVFAVAAQYTADYIKSGEKSIKNYIMTALKNPKLILGVSLIPAGFFSYMFYLWKKVGDPMAFANIQRAWGRYIQNPFKIWFDGISSSYQGQVYLAIWVTIGVACVILLLSKKRWAESIIGIIYLFVPLSTALDSMPRYMIGSFVFILAATELISKNKHPLLNIIIIMTYVSYEIWLLTLWFSGNPIMI